jgi:hypothetical protein
VVAIRNSCVETGRTGSLANSAGIIAAHRVQRMVFLLQNVFYHLAKIARLPTITATESFLQIISGCISGTVAEIQDMQKAWEVRDC